MTPEQRSRCMSAVKNKDTKPEIIVRKYLFSRGLRFRVNNRNLPGCPDIVLKKYKTAVFIDGCFWHGHEGCKKFTLPKTNTEFWQTKIEGNRARDARVDSDLKAQGWRVLRIWECEIKSKAKREKALDKLYDRIVGSQTSQYIEMEPVVPLAAEPNVPYGKDLYPTE